MAYLIYVENVLMPVTPSKITRKVPGKNEEIELLGGKTVLNLQEPGLTEWSMDFLLPKVKYPFVNAISDKQELRSQDFYLTHFNTLMAKAKPFDFMIIRTKPNGVWDLGEENGTFKIDIPKNMIVLYLYKFLACNILKPIFWISGIVIGIISIQAIRYALSYPAPAHQLINA